jgi:hypothetical protein
MLILEYRHKSKDRAKTFIENLKNKLELNLHAINDEKK